MEYLIVAAAVLAVVVAIRLIKQSKQQVEQTDEEDLMPADAVEMAIEKENNIFYLYAADTREFLGQGTTIEEALQTVSARFPTKSFFSNLSLEAAERMNIQP